MSSSASEMGDLFTRVVPITERYYGEFENTKNRSRETWIVSSKPSPGLADLEDAAERLRTSDIPVAFPTETVYGLGADATRTSQVRKIFEAKGRPSDNPLIIHIADLNMLRGVMRGRDASSKVEPTSSKAPEIPKIYEEVIARHWPGPLTILLPNPENPKLAPEVTAGNSTFAVRMPNHPLAQTLIKLAGVPIAAPSANSSGKPSPTTAQHVLHDLNGKIEQILDGGPCDVGVESTVIDGLCSPPAILRPGGVSLEEIRACKGWEKVEVAYKDVLESKDSAPRAPGMKYKHYSPNAKVILIEDRSKPKMDDLDTFRQEAGRVDMVTIGIVRTRDWGLWAGLGQNQGASVEISEAPSPDPSRIQIAYLRSGQSGRVTKLISKTLGPRVRDIAHGLFATLREMDKLEADIVYIEGISGDSDIEAAVMNRLRKAASVVRSC